MEFGRRNADTFIAPKAAFEGMSDTEILGRYYKHDREIESALNCIYEIITKRQKVMGDDIEVEKDIQRIQRRVDELTKSDRGSRMNGTEIRAYVMNKLNR